MRKNIWSKYHIVLLFSVCGFILSCKSIKPVENEKDKKILNTKKLVDSIKHYECEVEWIKLKSETNVKFEDEKLEVTLNFRIKRDSLIWINASSFGVKIARAFIEKTVSKCNLNTHQKLTLQAHLMILKNNITYLFHIH